MRAQAATGRAPRVLAATSLLFLLTAAGATAAQDTCGGGPRDEQACFVRWAASGRYQEIIDYIETKAIGLAAHEKYFLGIAYYTLSGRTGAASLRCFYTTRATAYLESFLENRQQTMKELGDLGSADELKYTYLATRALESARETAGCEASGESLASLERYARRFLSTAVEDLFFNYGTPGGLGTPGRVAFDAQLGNLQEKVRGFVSAVSRMETNYALTQIEIDVGHRELGRTVAKLNAWRPGAVVPNDDSGRADYRFEQPMDALLQEISRREGEYRELAMQGGKLGRARAAIDGFITAAGASGMTDYDARRSSTVASGKRMIGDFTAVDNETTSILRTPAVAQLRATSAPEPAGIEARWSAIAREWRQVKPDCEPGSTKWYCQ